MIGHCCWCDSLLTLKRQPRRSSELVLEAHYWCPQPLCQKRQNTWAYVQHIQAFDGKKPIPFIQYLFVPLPKQVEFLESSAPYKLYGGAAGPGKSHAIRWALYRLAYLIPNFRALILRESYEELEQTHFADMDVEQELVGGRFLKGDHMMVWDHNKSRIIGGHMQDKKAIKRYLSTNYDVIACDEGSQYPPEPLLELSTRARSAKSYAQPLIGNGQFWVASNPGGPSASMLWDFFIAHTPDFEGREQLRDTYNPAEWVYTEALLDDNPYSAKEYEAKLAVLQSWRYKQLRYADWTVTQGAFFEKFSAATHARHVHLPRPLTGVVEAVDWGYTSPGCVGWFMPLGDNHWHCLQEWKFRQMTAEEVARGIRAKRRDLGIAHVAYTVVDPSMHNKTGSGKGESFAETFARFGVPTRKGDNDRVMGWGRLAAWFRHDAGYVSDTSPEGVPWLTFDPDGCRYLLRSIPALLADSSNPEDIDTALDDHGADMTRYFAQSRPPVYAEATASREPSFLSMDWFKAQTTAAVGVLR